MNFRVTNHALCVGEVRIIGVSTSSVFIIGDTQTIVCSSIFDTPPESVSSGPLTPLPPEEEEKSE